MLVIRRDQMRLLALPGEAAFRDAVRRYLFEILPDAAAQQAQEGRLDGTIDAALRLCDRWRVTANTERALFAALRLGVGDAFPDAPQYDWARQLLTSARRDAPPVQAICSALAAGRGQPRARSSVTAAEPHPEA